MQTPCLTFLMALLSHLFFFAEDVSEVSSDRSDEVMMVTRVPDEVIDLDDALLAFLALEREAVDVDANKTWPDPNSVTPPNRSHPPENLTDRPK